MLIKNKIKMKLFSTFFKGTYTEYNQLLNHREELDRVHEIKFCCSIR